MIVDQIVEAVYRHGDPSFARRLGSAQCVELPFSLLDADDDTLARLIPEKNGRVVCPWARPPYGRMIFFHKSEPSAVFTQQVPLPYEGSAWTVAVVQLILRDGYALPAFCAYLGQVAESGLIGRVWPEVLFQGAAAATLDEATRLAQMRAQSSNPSSPVSTRAVMQLDSLTRLCTGLFMAELRSILGLTVAPPNTELTIGGMLLAQVSAAFALMNCKNVSAVDVPPPRQARRRAAREGRPAPYTVKTLVLHVPGQPAPRHAAGTGTGTPLALHWVRGHFKTYTAEKPLMGKGVGTYWWTPHLAGDKHVGVVVKDYAVKVKD